MRFLKWLYPGMKIKRWIILSALGIFLIVLGTLVGAVQYYRNKISGFGIIVAVLGVYLLIMGIKRIVKSFITVFLPFYREKELVDIVYEKRYLSRGPKIVVIGGGTGLSVLLQGLKSYTSNISAIVTVADDGGSSGRLRRQFGMLPPGDIRSCLVALADAEPLMQDLFQFRFEEGTELAGHNFGNLFITVMTKLAGDFEKAIKESSKVLAIRGQVIPSTLNRVSLVATHTDGSKTYGETKISQSTNPIKRVQLQPSDCLPADDALEAIMNAEAVVLGPGSLYTSVLPNLLVKNIPEAIEASRAVKIYICNVMTQAGETDDYTASDHVQALLEHTSRRIIEYCIVNTGKVPDEFLKKYAEEHARPVKANVQKIRELGIRVKASNVISAQNYVRHNSQTIAKLIMNILVEAKFNGVI